MIAQTRKGVCLEGIVHDLSFQRLTDQEIVQWLHDEK